MTKPPQSKSSEHNDKLCAEFMAKSKIYSRYPRVCEQAECLPLDTSKLPAHSYNPSILRVNGKLWMTYRYHFAGDFRTRLGIAVVGDGGAIEKFQGLAIEGHSQEDARLFSLQAESWISWVESNVCGQTDPKCIVKYGKLSLSQNNDPSLRRWQIETVFQPDAGNNNFLEMEKNWCFFESDRENLFCVYDSWPEQVVFHFHGNKLVSQNNTAGVRWPYGLIRGGVILPYDGKLIRFFHSHIDGNQGIPEHRYFVGAALMEQKPPFKVLAVSKKPILYGSEVDTLKAAERKACPRWKPNVIFPCGAISGRDGWLLAAGINDSDCALIKLQPKDLLL